VQIRTARQQLGPFRCQRRISRQLGQAELNILDGQVARGAVVEMLERLRRALRLFAAHREFRAAARDRHVERGLDLPQVLVERAAKARESLVVDRVKLDFDRFCPIQTSSPRREWARAWVMRTSTYE
jgi:hypothetical protein